MLREYHIQICQRALGNTFSARALEVIIAATVGQDHIRYQFKHPHFHFDTNAFEAGDAYIEKQRQIVLETLKPCEGSDNSIRQKNPTTFGRFDISPVWEAFGRLTHSVQDFYAHTNYVQLWVESQPNEDVPPPSQIGALDPKILQHPKLHSGTVYLWDWLAFVPGFYALAYRLTPEDSHTHMNLDHPRRGPLFPYAFTAAVKRTTYEFEQIATKLGETRRALLTNR